MRGYTKTTTLGDEDCLILGVKEAYVRETSLPLDWTHCRMGMYLSATTDTDDNATYPNTVTPYVDVMDQMSIGLSNGVGTFGMAGNRYIGVAREGVEGNFPYNGGGGYSPLNVVSYGGRYGPSIGDGADTLYGGFNGLLYKAAEQPPTATYRYAIAVLLDFRLTSTGLVMSVGSHSGVGPVVTSLSTPNLRFLMGAATYDSYPELVGGWWATDPIGIRHLHIRYPAYFARLRIHAVEVMQLA